MANLFLLIIARDVVWKPLLTRSERGDRIRRNPHPQAESFLSWPWNHKTMGGSHFKRWQTWRIPLDPIFSGADPIYLLVIAADPISTRF